MDTVNGGRGFEPRVPLLPWAPGPNQKTLKGPLFFFVVLNMALSCKRQTPFVSRPFRLFLLLRVFIIDSTEFLQRLTVPIQITKYEPEKQKRSRHTGPRCFSHHLLKSALSWKCATRGAKIFLKGHQNFTLREHDFC